MAGLLTNLDNASEDGGLSPLKQALFAASQMFAQASAQGARTGQGVAAGLGAGGQAYQGAIEDKRKAKREKTKDEAERIAIEQARAEIEQNRRMAENMQRLLAPVDQGGAGLLADMSPEERDFFASMPVKDAYAVIAERFKPRPKTLGTVYSGQNRISGAFDPATGGFSPIGEGGPAFNPRPASSGGSNPYFSAIPTRDGIVSFDARTGTARRIDVEGMGGTPVPIAQDPVNRGMIKGEEAAASRGTTLRDVPLPGGRSQLYEFNPLTSELVPARDPDGRIIVGDKGGGNEPVYKEANGAPYKVVNGQKQYLVDSDQARYGNQKPDTVEGLLDPASNPFDTENSTGVASFLSNVMNVGPGQFGYPNDDAVSAARARLAMLRVELPAAMRDSARPLKMNETQMQALLGGDILESPRNRQILLNQVRDTLIGEYQDNLALLSDPSMTKTDVSKLNAKQKKIKRVIQLIGPDASAGISPEDQALIDKYTRE